MGEEVQYSGTKAIQIARRYCSTPKLFWSDIAICSGDGATFEQGVIVNILHRAKIDEQDFAVVVADDIVGFKIAMN